MSRSLAVAVALAGVAGLAAGPALAADAAHPTVVELFQSQGCSSCPPANAHVMALADRPDVLALSFQVTYWDQLGWKDTFGSPAFTARQWDYAHGLRHDNVWTPQVVINGRADVVGVNPGEIERALPGADRGGSGPRVDIAGGAVTVTGHAPSRPAEVWLVRYDPQDQAVAVKSGENRGKTLSQQNIVRALVKLGRWRGVTATYDLPAAVPATPDAALKTVVLVQAPRGGAILGVGQF